MNILDRSIKAFGLRFFVTKREAAPRSIVPKKIRYWIWGLITTRQVWRLYQRINQRGFTRIAHVIRPMEQRSVRTPFFRIQRAIFGWLLWIGSLSIHVGREERVFRTTTAVTTSGNEYW
jgi:hypothetical protein